MVGLRLERYLSQYDDMPEFHYSKHKTTFFQQNFKSLAEFKVQFQDVSSMCSMLLHLFEV